MKKHETQILKIVKLVLNENSLSNKTDIQIQINKDNFICICKFYRCTNKKAILAMQSFELDSKVEAWSDNSMQFDKMRKFILADKKDSLNWAQ